MATQVAVNGQLKVTPAPPSGTLGQLLYAPVLTGGVTTLTLGTGFQIANGTTLNVVFPSPPPGQTIVTNQVPTPAPDGTNLVFTVPNAPNPQGSLAVYRNGLRLMPGGDYTLAGAVITFAQGAQPQANDPFIVDYRF